MKALIFRARVHTNKKLVVYIAIWISFSFFLKFTSTKLYAQNTSFTIGTGGITGVYYSTGKAIAKIVNKKSDEYVV